jgi:lipooligosaccharide transport system ATP-binding protein
MKRRVMVAQALVHRPPVIVLDEPTAGVDVELRQALWSFIRDLNAAGHTIVLTTHYLEEAERLCNRLVIMDNGRILVEGSPEALVAEYVSNDIVETEHTPEVVSCLDRIQAHYEVFGDMVQVYTDQPREVARQLFESCNPGKVFARRGSLEDVFLKLTGRKLRD